MPLIFTQGVYDLLRMEGKVLGLSWYDPIPFSMSSSIATACEEFILRFTGKGANSPAWGKSLPDPGRWILNSILTHSNREDILTNKETIYQCNLSYLLRAVKLPLCSSQQKLSTMPSSTGKGGTLSVEKAQNEEFQKKINASNTSSNNKYHIYCNIYIFSNQKLASIFSFLNKLGACNL